MQKKVRGAETTAKTNKKNTGKQSPKDGIPSKIQGLVIASIGGVIGIHLDDTSTLNHPPFHTQTTVATTQTTYLAESEVEYRLFTNLSTIPSNSRRSTIQLLP